MKKLDLAIAVVLMLNCFHLFAATADPYDSFKAGEIHTRLNYTGSFSTPTPSVLANDLKNDRELLQRLNLGEKAMNAFDRYATYLNSFPWDTSFENWSQQDKDRWDDVSAWVALSDAWTSAIYENDFFWMGKCSEDLYWLVPEENKLGKLSIAQKVVTADAKNMDDLVHSPLYSKFTPEVQQALNIVAKYNAQLNPKSGGNKELTGGDVRILWMAGQTLHEAGRTQTLLLASAPSAQASSSSEDWMAKPASLPIEYFKLGYFDSVIDNFHFLSEHADTLPQWFAHFRESLVRIQLDPQALAGFDRYRDFALSFPWGTSYYSWSGREKDRWIKYDHKDLEPLGQAMGVGKNPYFWLGFDTMILGWSIPRDVNAGEPIDAQKERVKACMEDMEIVLASKDFPELTLPVQGVVQRLVARKSKIDSLTKENLDAYQSAANTILDAAKAGALTTR